MSPEAVEWRKNRAKKAHKAWRKKHGAKKFSEMGRKSAGKLTKKQRSERGKKAVQGRIAKQRRVLVHRVDW